MVNLKATELLVREYKKLYDYSYSIRPILPYDVGKQNWVWKDREQVTVSNQTIILFNGIWSPNLIMVRVEVKGTYIAILTPGQDNPGNLFFRENVLFTVSPRALDGTDSKYFIFSFTGITIEPEKKYICER